MSILVSDLDIKMFELSDWHYQLPFGVTSQELGIYFYMLSFSPFTYRRIRSLCGVTWLLAFLGAICIGLCMRKHTICTCIE